MRHTLQRQLFSLQYNTSRRYYTNKEILMQLSQILVCILCSYFEEDGCLQQNAQEKLPDQLSDLPEGN